MTGRPRKVGDENAYIIPARASTGESFRSKTAPQSVLQAEPDYAATSQLVETPAAGTRAG